jgi:hypothetical protein
MVYFRSSSPKRHLIFAFWFSSIGLYEAFKTFFISYYNSHKLVKLNEDQDRFLLAKLRLTINKVYPNTDNEIEPKFINKFYNACHRLFGIHPPGPDQTVFNEYSKPELLASDFFLEFEKCLVQFALAIEEVGTTDVKLGNYYSIAEILNNIRSIQLNFKYNEIEEITIRVIEKFGLLMGLILDDDLMVKRLKIRSTDPDDRIKEFGELVGKPVAQNPRQIRSLAFHMEAFLILVEATQWDQDLVKPYVENPSDRQTMVELINDYSGVTGKDIFGEAEKIRNQRTK